MKIALEQVVDNILLIIILGLLIFAYAKGEIGQKTIIKEVCTPTEMNYTEINWANTTLNIDTNNENNKGKGDETNGSKQTTK